MDRSWGSDDWISAQEDARRDDALDRWHETHEHPQDWPECWDCEIALKERYK
jgi:hypothetical protein